MKKGKRKEVYLTQTEENENEKKRKQFYFYSRQNDVVFKLNPEGGSTEARDVKRNQNKAEKRKSKWPMQPY